MGAALCAIAAAAGNVLARSAARRHRTAREFGRIGGAIKLADRAGRVAGRDTNRGSMTFHRPAFVAKANDSSIAARLRKIEHHPPFRRLGPCLMVIKASLLPSWLE